MSSSRGNSFLHGILVAVGLLFLYYLFFPRSFTVLLKETVQMKNRPTDRIIKKYQHQVKIRQTWMNMVDNTDQYARIYNNLAPEVFCAEEIKVGKTDDGGKWMCGPWNLPDDCVIFSVGLNNEVSYEEDIQGMTDQRCRLLGFDQGEQSQTTKERLSKIRANSTRARISSVTRADAFEYTLEDLMKMHNVDKIEILKIDIEGSEFSILPEFLKKHQVSQILIEVHGKPKQTLDFLRLLSSLGYLHFHYEINGAWHHLSEYAFIHESILDRYDATLLARYLT